MALNPGNPASVVNALNSRNHNDFGQKDNMIVVWIIVSIVGFCAVGWTIIGIRFWIDHCQNRRRANQIPVLLHGQPEVETSETII